MGTISLVMSGVILLLAITGIVYWGYNHDTWLNKITAPCSEVCPTCVQEKCQLPEDSIGKVGLKIGGFVFLSCFALGALAALYGESRYRSSEEEVAVYG